MRRPRTLRLVGALVAACGVAAASSAPAAAAGAGTWVVRGAGWGHSIGMSQYGAMEMARDGYTAEQILAHYYTGTTYDAVTDTQVIRVNILHQVSSATATSVALSSGGGAFTVTAGGTTMTGSLGESVTFTRSGASVKATCSLCSGATSVTGATATLVWDTAAAANRTGMRIGGTTYRDGRTVVSPSTGSSSTVEVVNHVRLHDEYLDYLREVPWGWPTEALRAQAAAARGYALRKYQAGVRSACACHVYDTTSDQVYGGYPSSTDLPYWSTWRSAVRATGSSSTGYVVRSNGSVIEALYSSSSGGRTENNEDVWGGSPVSYLRGVSDPWSLRPSNPNASWRVAKPGSSVAAAFGLPDIVRLDLRDRTANGGVHSAVATSSTGATARITGEQLRTRVGLKSIAVRHLSSRLSGPDRYATAVAVAKATVPVSAADVVLAAGDSSLVDAAVSGPLAVALGAPILLTTRDGVPASTAKELDRRSATLRTAWVIGGTSTVSPRVVSALEARGLTVRRLAGADRFETSALVAKEVMARRTVRAVVVAGGSGLSDALGVSGAASALGEPILLTSADHLEASVASVLTGSGATAARVLGGTSRVGDEPVNALASLGLSTVRLSGPSRFATSLAVANYYRSRVPTTAEVVLASGDDAHLVDSLVVATHQRLIVLTRPTWLPSEAAEALQRTPLLEEVVAVGGTSAVSNGTLRRAARS